MRIDEEPEEEDPVFRLLLDSEEHGKIELSTASDSLSLDEWHRFDRLKEALEAIRIASSNETVFSEKLDENFHRDNDGTESPFHIALSNRFEVVRQLGSGGFGVVLLAWDKQLQCNVALKVPRPDILLTTSLVKRFLREAQNVAKLSHPNIVPLLGTDETSEIPVIAYYFCDGPTLSKWLAEQQEPVTPQLTAQIGILLAAGAQHAHSRGILHRDIKPSNIILEPSTIGGESHGFLYQGSTWTPRITDFGISKTMETDEGERQTYTGAVVGTLEYMPPEQISGRQKDIGTHSDIYSLGVVLFELLAKQLPFTHGQSSARAHGIAFQEPPSIRRIRPDVSRSLNAILTKCLKANGEERYHTAKELSEDLTRFLNDKPVLARSFSPVERLSLWTRRQPALASLLTACTVSIAFGIGLSILYFANVTRYADALGTANEELVKSNQELKSQKDIAEKAYTKIALQNYAIDMAGAWKAYEAGDLVGCKTILTKHQPKEGTLDLREVAWRFLWNKLNRPSQSTKISESSLYFIAFSNDGKRVGTVGKDGMVRVYDYATRIKIKEWNAGQSEVNCLAFSDDDRILATAGDDGHIGIWDFETSKLIRRIPSFKEPVHQVCFYDFGGKNWIIACGRDPVIRIFHWETGELVKDLIGHRRTVQSLSLNARDKRLFSASDDGSHREWNLESFELEHENVDSAFSKQTDVLASNTSPAVYFSLANNFVRRRNGADPTEEIDFIKMTHAPSCLAMAPQGNELAIADRSGSLTVIPIDANGQKLDNGVPYPNAWLAEQSSVNEIAYSGDGVLHSVGEDGSWKSWTISPRTDQIDVDLGSLPIDYAPRIRRDHLYRDHLAVGKIRSVNLVDWSIGEKTCRPFGTIEKESGHILILPGGQQMVTYCYPSHVGLWTRQGNNWWRQWNVDLNTPDVLFEDFEPTNGWLAVSVSEPRRILILDIHTGKVLNTLIEQTQIIGAFKFLNHGKSFAFSVDNIVRIGNMSDKSVSRELVHERELQLVVPYAEDRRLLTTSKDLRIRVWNLENGDLESTLEATEHSISSVLVSPNQKNIFTFEDDDTFMVWDARVMQPLLRYRSKMFEAPYTVAVPREHAHDRSIRLTDQYLMRQKRNRVIADRIELPTDDGKRY